MAKTKQRMALSPEWQSGRRLDDVNIDLPELLPVVASLDTTLLEQMKPSRVSRARKRVVTDETTMPELPASDVTPEPMLAPDVMKQDFAVRAALAQSATKAAARAASRTRKIEPGPAVKAFRELIAQTAPLREPPADFSEPLTGDPAPQVLAPKPEPEVVADRPAPVVAESEAPASKRELQPAVKQKARSGSDVLAYLAAVGLASVAGYFSVSGMAEIFPGAPVEVMTLAATMEAGKLIIVGWLAAHWRDSGFRLRAMLTTLVLGLALINGIGVFGKLVEAHVGAVSGVQAQVAGKVEAMDVRINAQAADVADLDRRIAQIDSAIDEATRRGRVNAAMALAEQKRRDRDALTQQRAREAATLTALRTERANLGSERAHAEAAAGPVRYLATLAGTDTETAVRWLILLMVACCDPAAIGLTIAAAGRKTAAA